MRCVWRAAGDELECRYCDRRRRDREGIRGGNVRHILIGGVWRQFTASEPMPECPAAGGVSFAKQLRDQVRSRRDPRVPGHERRRREPTGRRW